MTTRLKSILGRLALLACLSLSGFAHAAPQASLPSGPQTSIAVQQTFSTTLAWQRVGSPLSLHA